MYTSHVTNRLSRWRHPPHAGDDCCWQRRVAVHLFSLLYYTVRINPLLLLVFALEANVLQAVDLFDKNLLVCVKHPIVATSQQTTHIPYVQQTPQNKFPSIRFKFKFQMEIHYFLISNNNNYYYVICSLLTNQRLYCIVLYCIQTIMTWHIIFFVAHRWPLAAYRIWRRDRSIDRRRRRQILMQNLSRGGGSKIKALDIEDYFYIEF